MASADTRRGGLAAARAEVLTAARPGARDGESLARDVRAARKHVRRIAEEQAAAPCGDAGCPWRAARGQLFEQLPFGGRPAWTVQDAASSARRLALNRAGLAEP